MFLSFSIYTLEIHKRKVTLKGNTYRWILPKLYTQIYASWSVHTSICFLKISYNSVLSKADLKKRHLSTVLMLVEYDFVILINVWLFPMDIFQAINKKHSCSVKSISMCIPLYLAPKYYFIFSKPISEKECPLVNHCQQMKE